MDIQNFYLSMFISCNVYLQLLNKSPHDGDHDESTFSHDNTQELDLNDTAQAAQLQKELDRIQELRRKQVSNKFLIYCR